MRLYHGAAGISWALGELDPGLIDREVVDALETRIVAQPDAPDFAAQESGSASPGRSRSPSGIGQIRLVATALPAWPVLPRLAALEIMFGHPGHMALAAQLHARTGEERWAEIWSSGARRLLDEWRYDEAIGAWFWTQRFGARRRPLSEPRMGWSGTCTCCFEVAPAPSC